MKYRWKKIWLNTKRTRYCICRLYNTKEGMQAYYTKYELQSTNEYNRKNAHDKVLGASLNYVKVWAKTGKYCPETSTVLLHVQRCGAGIVAHEFLHAVIHAWHHSLKSKQYPVIIKSMKQEEELLHNHSYALNQFYTWYWKVVKQK